MPAPGRKIQFIVWGGLSLIIGGIIVAFAFSPPPPKPLPVYGNVPDFSLSDQNGRIVSLAGFKGKIWIADLIFTRCPGQCLLMSATMSQLQSELPADLPVRLVSITCDPEYDTPAILKKYGEKYGARDDLWTFLTGPKKAIHNLAVDGLKLPLGDKPPAEQESPDDRIIHSTRLVLIDQQGRIRGYFIGETPDCIPGVIDAIRNLVRNSAGAVATSP